ncbi:hypothetical protein ACNKXS_03270 [Christiangramia marina]|uniref:hypothetical protein n=1 Tax=Christiangramia marina TaxID=409436 RepID=UPI003AA982C2
MKTKLIVCFLFFSLKGFCQTDNTGLIEKIVNSIGSDTEVHKELLPWEDFMDLNLLTEKSLEFNWNVVNEEQIETQFREFIKCCDLEVLRKEALNTSRQKLPIIRDESSIYNNFRKSTKLTISKPLFCNNRNWGLICTSYVTTMPSNEKIESSYLRIYQRNDDGWILIKSIQLGFN